MARKKTRKQKIKAAKRKVSSPQKKTLVKKATESTVSTTPKEQARVKVKSVSSVQNLLDYDGSLIVKDLFKTIGLSVVVVGIQLGLFLYLR